MPDNTKTLYETAAPSGAADALFGMFKQDTEMEQYAKKKDIDTNAAVKLKEQENKFSTGLLSIKNQFQSVQADKEFARSQETARQALQATLGMATEAAGKGIPMPGIIKSRPKPGTEGLDAEAAFAGVEALTPEQVPAGEFGPGAAGTLQQAFGNNMMSYLRQLEDKNQLSLAAVKNQMARDFGQVNDDTLATLRNMHKVAEATKDLTTMMVLNPYVGPNPEPLSIDTYQQVIVPQLIKFKAAEDRNRALVSIAASRGAIQKEIAAGNQSLSQQRLKLQQGALTLTELDRANARTLSAMKETRLRMDQLDMIAMEAEPGSPEATKAMQQRRQAESDYRILENLASQRTILQSQIAVQRSPVLGDQVPPGTPSPATGAPSSDPLGIRKNPPRG